MLTAIGVLLFLAGVLAMLFGDKQIPVRDGGIILKLFDRWHANSEEGDFSNWPYKYLFGGALIVAGVLVLRAASGLT